MSIARTCFGRALCIGVDAEDDARTFAAIARRRRFAAPELLLGARATREAVRAKIREMALASEPGDLFLLTFSGHGGRTTVAGGRGEQEAVGTWQLYDGSLNEEQLVADLSRFAVGVRVLVVSDNCGGGIPSMNAGVRAVSLRASVLVISACQSEKYADGPGFPGHFANVLERTWNGGAFEGAYEQFHAALCGNVPDYQQPDYYRVGARDAAFEAQRPFSIR
jgi:hypothetical protein